MKQITVEDFDKAVSEVGTEFVMEHDDEIAKMFLLTVVFAGTLRQKLFFKQHEEEKEDK